MEKGFVKNSIKSNLKIIPNPINKDPILIFKVFILVTPVFLKYNRINVKGKRDVQTKITIKIKIGISAIPRIRTAVKGIIPI